jgi:hypothetical protein
MKQVFLQVFLRRLSVEHHCGVVIGVLRVQISIYE